MRATLGGGGFAAVGRGGRIIVTADDFGRTPEINAAVLEAHREGILTSASLMVTGEAFDEAVALARRTPTLAVGLHVVLTDGRSVLPHDEIPHLVDRFGLFLREPVRAGLRYYFSRKARAELARELHAQFERFAGTGLPLSHVDGHLHMHLHPAVFGPVVSLAARHGARGIRIPRDRLSLALRCDRKFALSKAARAAVFAILSRWCLRRMRDQPFSVPARTYGLMQSGRMSEAYVLEVLRRVREPSAEIYFHPTTGPRLDPFGPNPGDLQSLVSPAVRQAIEDGRLQLTTYSELAAGSETPSDADLRSTGLQRVRGHTDRDAKPSDRHRPRPTCEEQP